MYLYTASSVPSAAFTQNTARSEILRRTLHVKITARRYLCRIHLQHTRAVELQLVVEDRASAALARKVPIYVVRKVYDRSLVGTCHVGDLQSVIVVEKAHFLGGDTCVAGGGYNAADRALEMKQEMTEGQRAMVEKFCRETPRNELHSKLIGMVQKQWEEFKAKNEKGLFDSPEYHALQSWAAGDYVAKLDLIYEMCRMSPATLKTLADMGLKWDDYTTQYIGALWPRSHKASNYKSGVGFIDTYINLIKTKNYPVKYIMQTRATDFIVENGRVVGIKAKGDNGANYELRAKNGVVLATGGFSANVDMRQKYDTIWDKKLGENVKTTNVPAITGDGIVMAEKIGANLIDMGLIQLLSNTDPATGATNHKLGQSTCIFVNKDGKRFVNELGRRDVLSKAALAQEGGVFYVITCESTNWVDKDGRNLYGIKVADLLKQKKVFKGDTIEAVAKATGVPEKNLVETVKAFNAAVKAGKAKELDPPYEYDEPHALETGPFYMIPAPLGFFFKRQCGHHQHLLMQNPK